MVIFVTMVQWIRLRRSVIPSAASLENTREGGCIPADRMRCVEFVGDRRWLMGLIWGPVSGRKVADVELFWVVLV